MSVYRYLLTSSITCRTQCVARRSGTVMLVGVRSFANGFDRDVATSSRQQQKRNNFSARGYILLVVPVVTFCLGTWQVQRRKWKLALIEELESKTRADPIPFPVDLDALSGLEYRKVKVRGRFDHSQELYVMPRSPVNAPDRPSFGSASQSGANVITAFHVSDHNLRILVNRGWVPRTHLRPETRPAGQIDEEIEFVGVVRKTEPRQQFTPPNDATRNQWYHKDIEAMSQVLNTAPVLLDADHRSTVAGGPIGGQTRVTLRNEHLSYIVTWYSLSALTAFMWFRMFWK